MIISLSLFLLGFVLLIKGADIFVDGASSIARKFHVSNLVIGLTIVAFGTSAPEFIVSAIASFKGSADIAIGNVIGSNISNTLLILGVIAIITPIVVKKNTINNEFPFSILAILAVGFLVNDSILNGGEINALTRSDGLILLLFFMIFMYYTFGLSKVKEGILDNFGKDEIEKITKRSNFYSIGMVIIGALGLFLGGEWIVKGASNISLLIGLSHTFVALFIVALGTSLPELVTSVTAAKKGKIDMAVGNIIGSNIFNLLWVLGFSAVIMPIKYSLIMNIDIVILFCVSVLLMILIFLGKKNFIARKEGYVLLSLYVFYIMFLFLRG